MRIAYFLACVALPGAVGAQDTASDPAPIQDNSFLIEEAYNQPPGVVQHINTFALDRGGKTWGYSFTQEWPLFTQRHQLSYAVPVERTGQPNGTGVGDIAVNYRYQLPLDRYQNLAIAPRLSLLLPTGEASKGRGAGGVGVQTNLPVSAQISKALVTHFNVGATYTPSAKNQAGDDGATTGFNVGQSLIWLTRPTLNFMLELAWESAQEIGAGGSLERAEGLTLAPGIRGAINFSSGLQIVPGIAVPIGLGPSKGERAIFFYLSFEHPFSEKGRQ
ncbi:MAG: transporter [Gemmatimonadales bacterium]